MDEENEYLALQKMAELIIVKIFDNNIISFMQNKKNTVTENEIKTFLGFLLLTGYK